MTLKEPLVDQGHPVVQLPETTYAEGDMLSFQSAGAFEGRIHMAYVQTDRNSSISYSRMLLT